MNDAQTWTVIGGFMTVLIVGMGLVLRVVQVEIRSVHMRIDNLDRDVQRLVDVHFKQQP